MRRLLEVGLFASLLSCGPDALVGQGQPRPTARRDALRPDTPGTTEPAPNFAPGDVVERFSTPDASVVVHFTRLGTHRVPGRDLGDSGVPDFVESVEATWRDVLATYHGAWGFRRPPDDALVPADHGPDSRFDVYLVDFALRADGAFRAECLASDPLHCAGYMVQENDFAGYAYPTPEDGIVTVSSHEYFHGVQAGYSSQQASNLNEGTAVWATERYAPRLDDLEGFSGGYLSQPDRSLDQEPVGPVDTYSYGLGLFFECLSAQRGENAVLELWQRIDGGTSWLTSLDESVSADGGVLAEVLERCSDYNLFTANRTRAGYGHARAERLALAATTEAQGAVSVPRVRMFRASSRYYHAFALPPDAVVWWKTADDAPDGGARSLRVRLVPDVAGPVQRTVLAEGAVTPIGSQAAFVLLSNVGIRGASVPVGLCVGSPTFVDACRGADGGSDAGFVDAGVGDAGQADGGEMMMPEPEGCGCSAGGAPLLALLALALGFRRRS
ncbi:MAG: hypothetical protein IPJ65_36320 [Archangiaceae bacterium]|nr:hypothetical protein [Archangiaceae bacterium]